MFKREKRSSNNWKVNCRTDNDGFYENKSDRHFRGLITYNNKTKETEVHPNYIVGEKTRKYMSYGITHDKYKGKGHSNKRLEINPEKNAIKTAYLRKQLNVLEKTKYSPEVYSNFKMSKNDDDYVTSLIEKQKQKKK